MKPPNVVLADVTSNPKKIAAFMLATGRRVIFFIYQSWRIFRQRSTWLAKNSPGSSGI